MYLDHFGLSQFPFSATSDTQFFQDLGGTRPTFLDLIKALNRPDGFVAITGAAGMGKTTLCRKLVNSLNCHRSRYTTLHLAYPHLDPEDMFRAVAHELKIEDTPRPTLPAEVEAHLKFIHQQGQRIVVIIDEAQAVPVETLNTLQALSTETVDQRQLIQPILFGQPTLLATLNSASTPALRERLTSSWVLAAMDNETSAQYISQRLQRADANSDLLGAEALSLLIAASGGIPRLLNQIAHKALLAAWRGQQASVAKYHVCDAISEISAANSSFKGPQHVAWLHRIPALRRGQDTRQHRRGVVSR